MAIITDPDNLDRFQVLVDYENEFISIRPVNTDNPLVLLQPSGVQVSGGAVLTDADQDFSGSGVSPGDYLVIVEGPNINHWPINVVASTSLTVETGTLGAFSNDYTGQYAVYPATGGSITDGATLQAIYSFLKEEWKTPSSSGGLQLQDLISFIFPLESITREQFEIGGATHSNWDWKDNSTRDLIRTAGWNKLDAAGTVKQQYAGVVTLGSLDSDTQVYYQQVDSASGTPTDPKNFVLLGTVNQAIKFKDNDASEDFSTYLKLFARKKGKSYPDAELADIGVTTLENIVNRFPLSHIDDAAIVELDGTLAGTGVWQSTSRVFGNSDGATSAQLGSQQEQTFTFTSASSDFTASGIKPKDLLATGSLDTLYEITSVGTTTLTCLQEPGVDIPTASSIPFNVYTRVRFSGLSDGSANTAGAPHTTGTFTSAGATFSSAGVSSNDILAILNGDNNLVGVYKILSTNSETELSVNTTDQSWLGGPFTSLSYEIYRPGMQLQYKNESATTIPAGSTVITSNTIQQVGIDFEASGYVVGGTVTLSNSEDLANDGSYLITNISTDTITVPANSLTANADDTTVVINGSNGFIRTPQSTPYSYNWRLFGNNGTLAQCFQWIQKQLRRGANTLLNDAENHPIADIDNASGIFRGDVTDLLMSFTAPNGTTLNMYIDDLSASDSNNVTFEDVLGVGRNFAFLSSISITVNENLINDTSSKLTVFFTTDGAGNDYDTSDAIIVQDVNGNDMRSTDLAGDAVSNVISYSYDYDNNSQRQGVSAGTEANFTIVGIGTSGAQWVRTAGSVTRQNVNNFSLVANLERNYQNV